MKVWKLFVHYSRGGTLSRLGQLVGSVEIDLPMSFSSTCKRVRWIFRCKFLLNAFRAAQIWFLRLALGAASGCSRRYCAMITHRTTSSKSFGRNPLCNLSGCTFGKNTRPCSINALACQARRSAVEETTSGLLVNEAMECNSDIVSMTSKPHAVRLVSRRRRSALTARYH